MNLTVLCDNNTFIDSYLVGEPALSFYIENSKDKILFDLGYSNVFKVNAEKRNINLEKVNKIVLSHGHDDHTHGLKWQKFNSNTKLFYCNGCFEPKKIDEIDLTAPYTEKEMSKKFVLNEMKDCTEISKNLYCLGPIARQTKFEKDNPKLKTLKNGKWVQDKVLDDTALVYNGKKGLFVMTACSHSGVCNICEQAKRIFKKKILAVIGGFHLFELTDQAKATIEYLKNENIPDLYPCHCTSLCVKAEMIKQGLNVHEVGSGLEISFM